MKELFLSAWPRLRTPGTVHELVQLNLHGLSSLVPANRTPGNEDS